MNGFDKSVKGETNFVTRFSSRFSGKHSHIELMNCSD